MVESSAGRLLILSALLPFFVVVASLYALFIWSACGLAYFHNRRLPHDDPHRRDFHVLALVLAPFTLPFIGIFWLFYLILRAILFTIMFSLFMILFPVCLLIFRSYSILRYLVDRYQKLGRKLLKLNMSLLHLTGLFASRA